MRRVLTDVERRQYTAAVADLVETGCAYVPAWIAARMVHDYPGNVTVSRDLIASALIRVEWRNDTTRRNGDE